MDDITYRSFVAYQRNVINEREKAARKRRR
jgi:hypothetical protein